MRSSTSNFNDSGDGQRRAVAWSRHVKGLLGAAVVIGCVELVVEHNRLWYVDEATAMWEEKARLVAHDTIDADLVALGSSRLMHGLIPNYVSQQIDRRCSAYNLALSGMHPQGCLVLLERLLRHTVRAPRVLLLEFSPAHLAYSMEQTYGSPYLRALYDGRDIIRALRWDFDPTLVAEWGTYRLLPSARYRQGLDHFLSETLTRGVLPRFYRDRNRMLSYEFAARDGYRPWRTNSLPADYYEHHSLLHEEFSVAPAMEDALTSILRLCNKREIYCVFVPAPLPEPRVRARRDSGYEEAALAWLYRFIDSYPDTAVAPVFSFPLRSFCDPTHLNPTGAREFSIELGGWLAQHHRELGLDRGLGAGLLIRMDPLGGR